LAPSSTPGDAGTPPACLNCGAPLAGEYCAACGQRAIDPSAPTWHVVRDVVAEAADLDGRVLSTARALISPGLLTAEFLRGRRALYLGPLKLALLAGVVLTTTWVATRGVDSHYYGLIPVDGATVTYINSVVRGSLAASAAIAIGSWGLAGGRRRLLDEMVFALHLNAALSLLASAVIWLGTMWKLVWGTVAATPSGLPSLPYLLFLPSSAAGLVYITLSIRRVHGSSWWLATLRATILAIMGMVSVWAVIYAALRAA
jgi:hypothetical protein